MEHGPEDVDADRDLLRGESASAAHGLDEAGEVSRPGEIDVLYLAAQHVALPHRRPILGTR